MYLIFYRYEGKPPIAASYRGTEPIKTYASRQRSIYRADQVEVFDESGMLVCIVGPNPRRSKGPQVPKLPHDDNRRRPLKRRLQPVGNE